MRGPATVPAVIRFVSLLLVFGMLLPACGGEEGASTTATTAAAPAPEPEEALGELLAALANRDYAATAPLVDEEQLALFASIESSDPGALETLIEDGLTEDVRANFWASFVDALPGLDGASTDQILVGTTERFVSGDQQFARIGSVFLETSAVGDWILRQNAAGGWVVDVIATFGIAFIAPLYGWLETMTPAARAPVSRVVAAHGPSWGALAEVQGNDEAGVFVVDALERLETLTGS